MQSGPVNDRFVLGLRVPFDGSKIDNGSNFYDSSLLMSWHGGLWARFQYSEWPNWST